MPDSRVLYITSLVIGVMGWLAFDVAFLVKRFSSPKEASPQTEATRRDRRSILGILCIAAGVTLMLSLRRRPFTPIWPMSVSLQCVVALIGVLLSIAAPLLAWSAVRVLGRQWSLQARLLPDHELITSGPYRIVRHPIYTAILSLTISIGLAVSSWPGLVGGVIFVLIGTRVRIRAEEKLLREKFAEEYAEYARRTPALIPMLV